ncbi:MAG: tetratricopeptide repeat protein [Deltaproteobacteria bacterium]|nr:tetratricopeptide repeat protein [Deltaproteobacteria bacterium]
MVELKREVRAQRENGRRLAERLDRLEASQAVLGARARAPEGGRPPAAPAVPELAVVRLKPKADPPPRLDTRKDVVEPPEELDDALFASSPGGVAAEEQAADAALGDALFEDGLQALKTGNLEGGVQKLRGFVSQHPRHVRADNALYFVGVGLQGIEDLPGAAQAFQGVLDGYPAGDAVLDALLRLAACRSRMGQGAQARQLYGRIMSQYPGTAAAAQAQVALRSSSGTGDAPGAGP